MAIGMRRLAFVLAFGLFLFFLGCDSTDPGPITTNSITGTWRGALTSTNAMGVVDTFLVDLDLTEARTEVTGNGSVTGPNRTVSFEVLAGSSYLHPTIDLNLFFDGFQPPLGDLSGNVAADRMSIHASMDGPGFSGIAELQIVLTRVQP
jgi:hypothetical protein